MRPKHLTPGVLLVTFFVAVSTFAQQPPEDKSKRPSPPATAAVTLNGKQVTIDYSRPSLKGRKVGQELAPYGQVWRTGANEATTLTTEVDLNIGGTKVPAGKYTLWTLPSESDWKLIINKQTGQFHTEYHPDRDFGRVPMNIKALSEPVETLRFQLKGEGGNKGTLAIAWEKTEVSVPFTVLR